MIFDDAWLAKAKASSTESWASEVAESLDIGGQIYLSTLRMWFERFPLFKNDKLNLRERLENFNNADHLGGVNEVAFWAFFQREGLKGKPVPTSSTPTPDFQLDPPADCFVEVSTLNMSDKERQAITANESIALNHAETIRRLVGKLTEQKQKQLKHAAVKGKAGVLAIFDYTNSSGYQTQFFRVLAKALLGQQLAFKNLPQELSAVIYLERKVIDGRILLSRQRSAIYHNPCAQHSLLHGLFPSITEFWSQIHSVNSQSADHWISL